MIRKLSIVLYLLLTCLPLAGGMVYALLYSLELTGLLGRGLTLTHWQQLYKNGEFVSSLLYSLYLSLASLVPAIVLALALAYYLVFRYSGKGVFPMLFLPLGIPPLVAAFAFFYLLSPSGFFSRIAYQMQLISQADGFVRWVNDAWSVGILLTHIWLVAPFFTLVFVNTARKERLTDMQQMSQTLGAGSWYFACSVYVPVLLQRAAPLLVLYAIFLSGAYEIPVLLGRQSPRSVAVLIVDKLSRFDLQTIPQGYAIGFLYSLLIIGLVSLLLYKRKTVFY